MAAIAGRTAERTVRDDVVRYDLISGDLMLMDWVCVWGEIICENRQRPHDHVNTHELFIHIYVIDAYHILYLSHSYTPNAEILSKLSHTLKLVNPSPHHQPRTVTTQVSNDWTYCEILTDTLVMERNLMVCAFGHSAQCDGVCIRA